MAVLAVALAGSSIGSALIPAGLNIFGTTISGSALGWAAGSVIGSMLFAPKGPTVEGPRLQDLAVQTSTEGAALPEIWGTWRLAGNVFWSSDIVESRSEEEVGGKGGGGATQVSYSYSASFAAGLCDGPIVGVRRIWADGKLIYDVGSAADAASVVASNSRAAAIRIYTGSETQLADPTIQAHVGAADTPAYRGTAYLVFDTLQLADFANRIPNITAEVVAVGSTTVPRRLLSFASALTGDAMAYENGALRTGHWTAGGGSGVYTSRLYGMDGTLIETRTVTHSSSGGNPTMAINDPWVAGPLSAGATLGITIPTGRTAFVSFRDDLTPQLSLADLPSGLTIDSWERGVSSPTHVYLVASVAGAKYIVRWPRAANGNGYGSPVVAGPFQTAGINPFQDCMPLCWDGANLWSFAYRLASGSTKHVRKFDADLNLVAEWTTTLTTTTAALIPFTIRDDLLLLAGSTGGGAKLWRLNSDGTATDLTSGSALTESSDMRGAIFSLPGILINQAAIYAFDGALSQGSAVLSDIVSALCADCGLSASDIDVTGLASTSVRGFARTRPMSARDALQSLQNFHSFDVVESSGKVKFVKRGGAAVAALAAADLGADARGEPVQVTRAQEIELPVELVLGFADADRDHQPGTVPARRLVTASRLKQALEFPVLATSAEAAGVADILLRDAWRSRASYRFSLPPRFAHLDPADVITLPVAGQTHQVRLTRAEAMPAGAIRCEAVSESQSAYTSAAAGTDAGLWQGQSVALDGPTNGALLDLPALRDFDGDAGLYLAASGYLSGWRGGVLYKSSDGGATWTQADAITTAAMMGVATTVLATGRADIFDEANTLTVRLASPSGALSSATEASVLAGSNACAVGAPGRWEVLQFKVATDNGDGTWTLAGLLRGRKGTEHAMGSHAVGDVFVLLTTGLVRLALTGAEIGAARLWKWVTFGQALEDVSAVSLSPAGVALECYAPVLLGGGRDGSGNITINWTRRNRVDHEWRDYIDVPMSEAAESYEVEVWTAGFGTLKRTITGLSTPTASYTSAQQTTDFGSNQASVAVRIYQLSATVGRGYPLQGTV